MGVTVQRILRAKDKDALVVGMSSGDNVFEDISFDKIDLVKLLEALSSPLADSKQVLSWLNLDNRSAPIMV